MCDQHRLETTHRAGTSGRAINSKFGLLQEDAMTFTFNVYRINQGGQRELVHTTQSAHEARELRDAGPGKMVVVVSDDEAVQDQPHDIEGNHLL
jgi:hypothetical protein